MVITLVGIHSMEETMSAMSTAVQQRKYTETSTRVDTGSAGVIGLGLFAAGVGIWAFAALAGGLFAAGGVGELLAGWVTAVFGI